MKPHFLFIVVTILCFHSSCSSDDDLSNEENTPSTYFPPINGSNWLTQSAEQLQWNTEHIDELYSYLEQENTRAFIILKQGKIVLEQYWGNNITNTAPFSENSLWYWASAGKTITASLVGIAQQDGFLYVDNKTSDFLGEGWTSMPADKEQQITIKHQLTMTSGLNYEVSDLDCTSATCLQYKADAGNQWYYHNAPYTLLTKVIESATNLDYNTYTQQALASHIGMNGQWISQGNNNVYYSTARDMARFGLLIANKGTWENSAIIESNYFADMVSTSQELNPSYGYLFWLNGKDKIIYPGFSQQINLSLASAAPIDLIAGMGKNGQFVDIVPSKELVVIRLGEAPENSLVPIQFHNTMWEKINLIIE